MKIRQYVLLSGYGYVTTMPMAVGEGPSLLVKVDAEVGPDTELVLASGESCTVGELRAWLQERGRA